MPVSRRQFIAGSLAGAISSLLFETGAMAADWRPAAPTVQSPLAVAKQSVETITLETIHASHFNACLKTAFQVTDESGAQTTLELIEVTEHASSAMETFSLIFKGPADAPLAQKIYQFRQQQLGELSIFIVPIGRAAEEMRYEAVFNRLIG